MTANDLLLAISLAAVAIAITVVDLLLFALRNGKRKTTPRRALATGISMDLAGSADPRQEAIRRRLAAIQSSGEREEP